MFFLLVCVCIFTISFLLLYTVFILSIMISTNYPHQYYKKNCNKLFDNDNNNVNAAKQQQSVTNNKS